MLLGMMSANEDSPRRMICGELCRRKVAWVGFVLTDMMLLSDYTGSRMILVEKKPQGDDFWRNVPLRTMHAD